MIEAGLSVGIDFDNTIICYEDLFHRLAKEFNWIPETLEKSKAAVKDYLVFQDGDTLRWQKLQSLAYGERILDAPPFPGVAEILDEFKKLKIQITIISHKSQTSHIDPKVSLRDWAKSWLMHYSFIDLKNIYFAETRKEKIQIARDLKVDIFIDDLLEVFNEDDFKNDIFPIFFSPKNAPSSFFTITNWPQLKGYLPLLQNLNKNELKSLWNYKHALPNHITAIKKSGNNRLHEVSFKDEKPIMLKSYFEILDDQNPRCHREFSTLSLMKSHGIENVPAPLWSDPQKKISIIAKMMGKSQPFNNKNKTQVIQFLIDLDRHFQNSEVSFEWGNDARQKLSDYSQLIEKRISQIALGCLENRYLDKIAHLLETQVLPLKNILIQDFNYQITKLNWNTESHFSKKQLTFSPSDFGSHNALTDDKNQLSFIDFEYAGADDPAKLFADFFSHVADQTPLSVKQDIFVSYAEHKQTLDPTFLTRFTLVKPLIQLEWVLIVLNIAAPENLKRRLFSNPSLSVEELINNRWQTATEMIKRF